MRTDNITKSKVVIIGTGMVGMSYAYALLNQGTVNELVLIDINKERAEGEAMDLNHGMSFAPRKMKIYAGEYGDCADADIVVITAGVSQKDGETRIDLLNRNASIMSEEEKKSAAYHGGEDFSGLMPYGQTQYGDALVRVNPALMKTPSRSGIHLIALSWSVSSDDAAEADKPRLYNKGSEGFYHTDYLMSKLYDNKEIWDKIFSLCE